MTETEFGFLMDAEPSLKSGGKIDGIIVGTTGGMTATVATAGRAMTPLKSKVMMVAVNTSELIQEAGSA